MTGSENRVEILLVDDDEGHLELVQRNLRRIGLVNPVIPVGSGAAALDYVYRRGEHASRSKRNLLILLDINMPGGMDGVEVLRRIKADPEKRKIPVIMLTTTDDPREVEECYALGCNVYMTKPVDPAAFVDAITRLGLFISIVSVPGERNGSL